MDYWNCEILASILLIGPSKQNGMNEGGYQSVSVQSSEKAEVREHIFIGASQRGWFEPGSWLSPFIGPEKFV
jgi:hypothetical protein